MSRPALGKAVVLGTGSWGCGFGRHLAAACREVVLWGVEPAQVATINERHANPAFLAGVALPPAVRATLDIDEAAAGAEVAFVVVPSQAVRQATRRLAASALPAGVPVVCLAKGLELETQARLSEVIGQELAAARPGPCAPGGAHPVAVLLGPSHAEEVARDLPTAVVLSGGSGADWALWQRRLAGPAFRIYTNDDLVGVEISSAFKNVIAVAAGLCDGLGLGDNVRGTLLSRGIAELARLGEALGGRAETFYGLSGIGDLVTTCTSRHSRNRNFGEAVARSSEDPQRLLEASLQVVEGVVMTKAALKLGEKCGIELPITKEVHDVLFSRKPPLEAIRDLMGREPKPENGAARGRPRPRSRSGPR